MNKLFHHHRWEPNFYWHSTNMFSEDVEVRVSKLKCSSAHSLCVCAHVCVCACVRVCVCVCVCVCLTAKTNPTYDSPGHSSRNCAGGILDILTQQGSISLQVTENDIIKLLLTLQTIPGLLRLYWQWIPSKQTGGSGLCPQSKTITSKWITGKDPSGQEGPDTEQRRTKNDTANKSEQPLPPHLLLSSSRSCSLPVCS